MCAFFGSPKSLNEVCPSVKFGEECKYQAHEGKCWYRFHSVSNTLHVNQVPSIYKLGEVISIFGEFGEVKSGSFLPGKPDALTRRVVISFYSQRDAETAVLKLNGTVFKDSVTPLDIKFGEAVEPRPIIKISLNKRAKSRSPNRERKRSLSRGNSRERRRLSRSRPRSRERRRRFRSRSRSTSRERRSYSRDRTRSRSYSRQKFEDRRSSQERSDETERFNEEARRLLFKVNSQMSFPSFSHSES
jgi:RNA recognition motif-containing protein